MTYMYTTGTQTVIENIPSQYSDINCKAHANDPHEWIVNTKKHKWK